MSVGILLVTHDGIGHDLLDTVVDTLGFCPLQTECLAVSQTCDPDDLGQQATRLVASMNTGAGILIMTDVFGATPSNLATTLACEGPVRIVTGVNLPMLLRVFNYPSLTLDELADKALTGGRDGIMLVNQA